jgi:succinylglutamate desuccinylase
MLKLQTKAELEALHTGNVKEGLHLEYKASDAIDKKDDSKKIEMARDVSAFANADGGQIVYGMTEKDHEPRDSIMVWMPKHIPKSGLSRCFNNISRRRSQVSGLDTFRWANRWSRLL